jgi:hypothetical protein
MAIENGQHDRRNRGTLAAWLRGALAPLDGGAEDRSDSRDDAATPSPCSAARLGQASVGACARPELPGIDAVPTSAVLVPFPIYGEALLVRLADALRNRAADARSGRDPLLLKMSRRPGSRLAIDNIAYVEFQPDRAAYHVVIEAASDTKVTLDTTDFDTLVRFVAQYVTDRPPEPATLEAVS